MGSLLWLLDKLSDAILPRLFLSFKNSWRQKPFRTTFLLTVLAVAVASGSSLSGLFPHLPLMLLGDNKIVPLRFHGQVDETRDRVNLTLLSEADRLIRTDPGVDVWSYGEILVGLGPEVVSTQSKLDHRSYFFDRVMPGRHCWTQFGHTPVFNPCHTGATSWALWAMSTNSIRPTVEMWTYLLNLQDSRGWWPLYQGAENNQEVASTYSTAIALLALQAGITSNAIDASLVDKARTAVMRAKAWLMSNRVGDHDCLWLAYPNQVGKENPSIAISGLALYALLSADPDILDGIAEACFSAFSAERFPLSEDEISGKILTLNNGLMISDSVRHQKAVWTILALSKLYPKLSLFSQSRLRGYFASTIFPDGLPPESNLKETWKLGEFALLLRSLR